MKSTVRTVGTVMIIMLFSRLMSLLSNMAYITFYGINLETDIYSYALQLPNIIFNSIGTAIVTAVIPIFAGYIGTGDRKRAFEFANNITGISLLFTTVLAAVGIVLSPCILLLTRFKDNGYGFALAALRIMFPVIIFHALNYILQGVLQSLGRYNMPALVSLPGSIVVISYVFLLGNRFGVWGLIIATFAGLALQAVILIPPAIRAGYRIRPSLDFGSEDIKKALRLVLPILAGTSAYQLNMLFNATLSANFKDTVAIITTVQNLVLYAILIFIYSVTSVVFPRFTMLAAKGDMEGFKNSLSKVLESVLFFLLPCSAGFIAVRYQLVDFLYGWGKVTAENVQLAGNMLALYAVGVTGIGIKEVADRAFYSLKDTKRPAVNGIIIMLVNIACSLILISFIGVLGIPAAYTISALTGGIVLMFMMRGKIGGFGGRKLLISGFKAAAASVIMLICVVFITTFLDRLIIGHALLHKALRLFVPAAAGAVIYAAAACLLKADGAVEILNRIKRKFGTNA